MKTIIGISGKAQHGKDTTADFFVQTFGGRKIALADLIKEQATFLGWDGEKDKGGRTLLQQLSTPVKEYGNWLANKYEEYKDFADNNYYTASLYRRILEDNAHDIFYVSDLRFKSEFEFLKRKSIEDADKITFVSLRVTRLDGDEPFDNQLTEEQKQHQSEIDLDDVEMDYSILNASSLDEYYNNLSSHPIFTHIFNEVKNA